MAAAKSGHFYLPPNQLNQQTSRQLYGIRNPPHCTPPPRTKPAKTEKRESRALITHQAQPRPRKRAKRTASRKPAAGKNHDTETALFLTPPARSVFAFFFSFFPYSSYTQAAPFLKG